MADWTDLGALDLRDALPHLLAVAAAALALTLWFGIALGRWLARRRVVRRIAHHRRLGADGEAGARRLLERAGYRVAERQPAGRIRVRIEGAERTFDLRGDFLVTRRRRRYLAEAKGGAVAADVGTAATRRQLLEYACAFEVDGLLLVDVQAGTVQRVEFPDLTG